jgi:hypothetical protein
MKAEGAISEGIGDNIKTRRRLFASLASAVGLAATAPKLAEAKPTPLCGSFGCMVDYYCPGEYTCPTTFVCKETFYCDTFTCVQAFC